MGVKNSIKNYLGINKHMSTSSHIRSHSISSRALSEVYDLLNFKGIDYGNTRKFIAAYSRNGIVFTVINKISKNAAALPRGYKDVNGEEITNSEIDNLLSKPNEHQSELEFRQSLNEYLLSSGNAFILYIEGVGMGAELEVLNPENIRIIIDSRGDISYYQYTDSVGTVHKYDEEEILHIKLSSKLNIDKEQKYWGLSPLQPLWAVVTASDDLFLARASIWKNKGYAGILTNKSDVPLLPKERTDLQDSFNEETAGAERANGVRVSSGDLSYLQLGMSPADLKLLEGNIDNTRIISAGYDMPSVLFNDVENSTYNNVLEAKKSAYTDAYIPLDQKVNQKLSVWLSDKLGVEEVIVIDVSRIDILKLMTNDVANRLNEMSPQAQNRIVGQMTQDEVRELVGLGVVVGEIIGDVKSNNKQNEEAN